MPMPPTCNGHPAVVRLSKLSPTGTLAGLQKAVSDHQAWYANHGAKTKVIFAPVSASNSGEFISITIDAQAGADRPPADEAWDAFVKEYDDNTVIEWTGLTCLTDAEAKSKAAAAAK
jgi:hypothetical protein